MAAGTYAINQTNLDPIKRKFRVKANKKVAKAGDVIKFTITATGVSDRTVRSYFLSENFTPDDIADGKTSGLFYLREGKAEVYIQISEYYDNDKDQTLRFNVLDNTTTLFRIKRPPHADVLIKGDEEPSQERDRRRLEGRERERLTQGRKGDLVKQDPIQRVRVSEVGGKALKYGIKSLPGIGGQRALPGGSAAALPPAGMRALPGVGSTSKLLPVPASQQIIDVTPISKSVTPMGGSLARSGGGAVTKGGAGALKGVRAPGALSAVTAGLEFGSRMNSGQNVLQAGAGTAASVGGGIAGMKAGAAAGAALGSVVPGIGTAIGGILGGILGGVAGSTLAAGAADAATGANRQEFAEGGHIIPKMTDMPFNLPGLSGSFNEPGNREILSITPLDDPLKAAQSMSGIASMVPGLGGIGAVGNMLSGGIGNLFGGKKKEYKGIAEAIADEMEDRGIGDPFGIKGRKSYGNMTNDLAKFLLEPLKGIFGGGGGSGGGSGGGGGGGTTPSGSTPNLSGDAVQQTAQMLRNSEGFREDPYWDVNAYRAGYGSSTYTTADGQVKRVQQGVKVSREDAERDLQRRITTEFMPKTKNAVGSDIWDRMPPSAQAALTSITYNYGSLPTRVSSVAKSTNGDLNAIADAVEALGSDDKGINMRRRKEEADVIRRSVGQQPAGGQQVQQMMQVSDFKEYNLESNDANSVVRMSGDNSLWKTNESGNITDQRVTLGEANQIMQQKAQQQNLYQSTQIRPGFQQTSYNPSIVPMSSSGGGKAGGTVIEYLTGDPNHMGYRADHAGSNYHEHLAFRTVEEKERAKAALIANGIQIGSELRPGDTKSYHSVGLALDVPASQVPVGQEPQLSVRVREILAANGFSGKGIGSSTGSQAPTGSPVQMNPGYQQTVDPNAPTAADAESFFGFSGARQGLSMSSAPTMSPPANQANNLLQTSAQTTIASAAPPNVVINSPSTSNVSTSNSQSGGGGSTSGGSTMSDSGLMAYMASQQLMTIGA